MFFFVSEDEADPDVFFVLSFSVFLVGEVEPSDGVFFFFLAVFVGDLTAFDFDFLSEDVEVVPGVLVGVGYAMAVEVCDEVVFSFESFFFTHAPIARFS